MAKKIRLGYDILSKRAIETESGINIDDALRQKDQEIAGINNLITNIEGDITNIHSNFDFVVIDPEHGDDTNDGLTRNTPVRSLARAAEVYVEKFGGTKVVARLITIPGPESFIKTKAGVTPNPGNCTNLFTTVIPDITDVYLIGEGSLYLSNTDYQTTLTNPVIYDPPNYNIHADMGGAVGIYCSSYQSMFWIAGLDIKSSRGDVYVTGTYGKDLPFAHLVADNGSIIWYSVPSFNTMACITTDYYFDGQIVDIDFPVCGKSLHVVSRSLEHQGGPGGSYAFGNWIGYGWIKGDILIESNSSIYVNNYCFCSGKFIVRSLDKSSKFHDYNDSQIQPTLEIMQPIYGRDNNDTSYNPGTPSSCTFPDIDIDWDGTVLLSSLHANNVHIKAAVFAMYASGSILSQNDIYVEADRVALNSYSTSNYWYCQGKMEFRSPNEIKIAQYLFTDELVIDAGGRPNDYPINYSDYKYPYWNTDGVTGISDIHCKITNLFETILGSEDPVLSTEEAHYFIKCSGDYADQWNTIQNGNGIVSLEVGGHAFLTNNGGMITKRLSLRSKSLYISNSYLYSSSFDIKTGQLFWKYGQLNQWYNYGAGWNISSSKSSGMSWTNDFEDRSSLNCDSLEQLDTYTNGFVHPGYGQKRRDWDINIKVLVPYRRVPNYYGGGPEYCAVLGYINQGSFNGSIAGEIGDVLVTDQKQSPYSHDWIFPSYYQSYYENNKFGNNVTLHIAHRKWHHIYIDLDQGSDAYDGMSKETPVKSVYGLDKVFKQMLYPNYVTIHVCGSESGNNRGSTSARWSSNNSIDFSYVLNTFTGGILYNWYAVDYLNSNAATLGIPDGWHIPTRDEFTTLTNFSNGTTKLKIPYLLGTDEYGFSEICQMGYYVYDNMNFESSYTYAYWTVESRDTNRAYYRSSNGTSSSSTDKYNIFPIRLVRNNTEGAETGTTGTIEIGGSTYNTVVIGTQVWITRNLDYQFSGGTYRTNKNTNSFDTTTTPQYGYYNYGSSNGIPYTMNNNSCYGIPSLMTIVADDPYLSLTIKGIRQNGSGSISMLKMYGFHTLNVLDCAAWVTDLQASVCLRYCDYETRAPGSDYPRTSILYLKGGNVYTYGISAGYTTVIEADDQYVCLSGDSYFSAGTSNYPFFYGPTYIHAKYIQFTGNQCTFSSGCCATLEADLGFRFGTPIKIGYGSLTVMAKGSGNISSTQQADYSPDSGNSTRSYFGIGTWSDISNVSVICPNQDLYFYTMGQSSDSSVHGRLLVEANELTLYGTVYGCDTDIYAKNNITFGLSLYGGGNRASLVNVDCGGTISGSWGTRSCNLKVKAREFAVPINFPYYSGSSSHDTSVYVNTERAANGIFSIADPSNGNYNLFARVTELAGPFYVYTGTPPLTYDGSFIKKFKGIVEFYTGSDPDNDLADFRDIAPNADFELIVLNRTKQLVAGQGISIADTGDEVVISSDPKSTIVQRPVTIENGTATVSLILSKYNIITGIDSTVTDLVIDFPVESTATLLTEVGFEFYLDAFAQTLNSVTFTNSTEQLSSVVPDEFTPEHIYQGVLVNRCITLVEYDRPDIKALEINGKKYKTVKIGEQIWMAENLADPDSGVWYNNDQATYEPLGYGKLYTWAEAEAIANNVPGWHLPTKNDFDVLVNTVGGTATAGTKLKSTSGWNDDGNGTDDFGFNAKPAGLGAVNEYFTESGNYAALFDGLNNLDSNIVDHFGLSKSSSQITGGSGRINNTLDSVRLVKDMSVNIGGRDYKVVQIGNQLWMAENLDWKFNGLNFRDSNNNPIDDTTDIQAAYFNYDESTYGINGNKYGLLYNWYAVDYINQHLESFGVPDGWHAPSKTEWSTLINICGQNPGTKLKSTSGWSDWIGPNGDDYYGFSAYPAGYGSGYGGGGFGNVGANASFWTSTSEVVDSYYRQIDNISDGSIVGEYIHEKCGFYSLRLVKNLT